MLCNQGPIPLWTLLCAFPMDVTCRLAPCTSIHGWICTHHTPCSLTPQRMNTRLISRGHPFATRSTHSQHAAPIHNMQHPFTTCSTHSQHAAPIHNTQHPFMPAAICMYDTCMSLFNCNAWHAFTLPMYMCAAHIPSTHALYGPHAYCNTHMHNPCHFSLTLRFGSGLGLSASGGYCVSGTPHHREGVMSGDDL